MAITIDQNSVSLTLSTTQAKPAVAVRSTGVVCHLTQGFNPAEQFDPSKPNASQLAWTALARLKIARTPDEKLIGWEFGFIQFQKVNSISFFYAGKTPGGGGIIIQAHEPPLMTQKTALDSVINYSPWTKPGPRFTATGNDVETKTGDHPMIGAGFSRNNKVTKQDNYLFHLINDREFFTILSVRNPDGKLTHLRNFGWKLRYDFKFNWRGGQPVPIANTSSISFGNVEHGAPKATELQSMLTDPVGPFSNDLGAEAIAFSVTTSNGKNRKDLDKRFMNVPADFFQ